MPEKLRSRKVRVLSLLGYVALLWHLGLTQAPCLSHAESHAAPDAYREVMQKMENFLAWLAKRGMQLGAERTVLLRCWMSQCFFPWSPHSEGIMILLALQVLALVPVVSRGHCFCPGSSLPSDCFAAFVPCSWQSQRWRRAWTRAEAGECRCATSPAYASRGIRLTARACQPLMIENPQVTRRATRADGVDCNLRFPCRPHILLRAARDIAEGEPIAHFSRDNMVHSKELPSVKTPKEGKGGAEGRT